LFKYYHARSIKFNDKGVGAAFLWHRVYYLIARNDAIEDVWLEERHFALQQILLFMTENAEYAGKFLVLRTQTVDILSESL